MMPFQDLAMSPRALASWHHGIMAAPARPARRDDPGGVFVCAAQRYLFSAAVFDVPLISKMIPSVCMKSRYA